MKGTPRPVVLSNGAFIRLREGTVPVDFSQFLRILRAHWLGITVFTLVGVAVAFGWSYVQPKVYTADSSAIIQARAGEGANDLNSASLANIVAQGRVKTYVEVGSSRSTADRVIDDLGLDTTPEALVRSITVSNPLDTVSLTVTANANTPQAASDLAEAWVRAMVAEVNMLETGDEDTQGATFLSPLDNARLPDAPSSPNVRLALALGGLVGLALGIAFAILRYTLDRRVRSVEGVEKATGVAVVGTIPEEKQFTAENRLIPFDGLNSVNASKAHLFAIAEAMRELRTNVQFMDVDNPPRTIVVTSPLPGDGKSTTSSNLAITLASAGQRTVLIDGDLRRPMIASVFGLVEGPGLTDVLAGRATLAEVAHTIGENKNLVVIAAGKVPPNPSEVVGSERMRELLEALAEQATVIVDAPPLIPVTDAAVIANRADGAVVVATVGKTTFDMLGKALANLERAGARALGIVLNRVPRRGSGAAYYGYQYAGDYYGSSEVEDEPEHLLSESEEEPLLPNDVSRGAMRRSARV